MENEAFGWRVLGPLYMDLSFVLNQTGDARRPEEVIALAVKSWLAERRGNPSSRGYQWASGPCSATPTAVGATAAPPTMVEGRSLTP